MLPKDQVNRGFKFYRSYGYYITGIQVRGTIGNPHRSKYWYEHHPTWTPHVSYHGSWIYRVRHNSGFRYWIDDYGYTGWIHNRHIFRQDKMVYYNPGNKKTDKQLTQQNKLRQAVLKWQSLSESEKNTYRAMENYKTIHEGFCFFVSEYIKSF